MSLAESGRDPKRWGHEIENEIPLRYEREGDGGRGWSLFQCSGSTWGGGENKSRELRKKQAGGEAQEI